MGKILNYKILGTALKSLSDACFKADEQQRNGEKVTACGMSDDDLDRLCDIIPRYAKPDAIYRGSQGEASRFRCYP